MQHNSEYTSDTFIARWIAGELTESEIKGLMQFMHQEPGAIRYFEEIKHVWFGINPSGLSRGLTSGKRWARLNRQLNLKPKNESNNGSY